MALAYGNFHELSHQIRFLLFEIGIGLPQNSIDYFITLAHRDALRRLQHAIAVERLSDVPIASHHIHDLIDQLQMKLKKTLPASQFFQWNTIRDEIDESIANEALALAYKQTWNAQIKNEASNFRSLWSWINSTQTAHECLLFLEQWGCTGNSYLPAFRAKTGFTRREVLQNSPEFQARISIHWCALSKEKVNNPLQSNHFKDLMAQEFPTEYLVWRERLILNHLNPEDYYPIPVHPWQWRTQFQMKHAPMIDNKSLILFPHHQSTIPSMLYDTMLSIDRPSALMKLSTSVHTSDSELLLWVNSLLNHTNNYYGSLYLADLLTHISLKNEVIPETGTHSLSASLHQNPIVLLKSDQKAVPLNSLFSHSPITNTPLIIEIIKESGLAPSSYFALYCNKILFSSLHLLLAFGVVLEAQHDNILVIFEENKPRGIILKNVDHINVGEHVSFNSIAKPGLTDSHFKAQSMGELRARFIQNMLQNNIKNWIDVLNAEYQIPIKTLWSQVDQVIRTIFEELAKDINPSILNEQKHLIVHDAWLHQCLFTMRLSSNSYKNIYVNGLNPLSL